MRPRSPHAKRWTARCELYAEYETRRRLSKASVLSISRDFVTTTGRFLVPLALSPGALKFAGLDCRAAGRSFANNNGRRVEFHGDRFHGCRPNQVTVRLKRVRAPRGKQTKAPRNFGCSRTTTQWGSPLFFHGVTVNVTRSSRPSPTGMARFIMMGLPACLSASLNLSAARGKSAPPIVTFPAFFFWRTRNRVRCLLTRPSVYSVLPPSTAKRAS